MGYAAPNVVIERTSIVGAFWALTIEGGSSCALDHVVLTNVREQALWLSGASNVEIRDCEFRGGRYGIVAIGSTIAAANLILAETTITSMVFYLNSQATVNSSHILPDSGLAFNCYSYSASQVAIDLTGNYWGTTDSNVIAAMIHDGNDDPVLHCTVLYEPFAAGPLPTESVSWGDLKAAFR